MSRLILIPAMLFLCSHTLFGESPQHSPTPLGPTAVNSSVEDLWDLFYENKAKISEAGEAENYILITKLYKEQIYILEYIKKQHINNKYMRLVLSRNQNWQRNNMAHAYLQEFQTRCHYKWWEKDIRTFSSPYSRAFRTEQFRKSMREHKELVSEAEIILLEAEAIELGLGDTSMYRLKIIRSNLAYIKMLNELMAAPGEN